MIRPIETSAGEATTATAAPAAAEPSTSFAELHSAALARVSTGAAREKPSATNRGAAAKSSATNGGAAAPASVAPAATGLALRPERPPPLETWAPVRGHPHYAKIITGPRRGDFVNLVLGPRHGLTFRIERRDGKAVHVYGSGERELVVDASKDYAPRRARVHAAHGPERPLLPDRPPKSETWAPVPGRWDYADILGGPRNGLYVNTSGGIRHGMAFQIVHQGGHELHVYGTGRHRLVVPIRSEPVHHHRHAQHTAAAGPASGSTTGGAAPSSPPA